jgi:hypothetical protein
MDWMRNRSGGWRGVALTLTVLALVLKILVPPGFMPAQPGERALITICTGHGPLVVAPDKHGGPKAPASKKNDAPCLGAGNISPPSPAAFALAEPPLGFAVVRAPLGRALDMAPGRGLAAPPPPSQGPPLQLS